MLANQGLAADTSQQDVSGSGSLLAFNSCAFGEAGQRWLVQLEPDPFGGHARHIPGAANAPPQANIIGLRGTRGGLRDTWGGLIATVAGLDDTWGDLIGTGSGISETVGDIIDAWSDPIGTVGEPIGAVGGLIASVDGLIGTHGGLIGTCRHLPGARNGVRAGG